MKKIYTQVLVLSAAAVMTTGALAADLEAGRKIAETQCAACHGKDGKSPVDPTYPKLAGQYEDYLYKALQDYQTGRRKNAIMGGMATPLHKEDMKNVAAYFASLPGPLTHKK